MKLALLNWRRGRSVPGRLGISLSTAGLTVACINGDGLLSHCENLPANNPKALADLVEANGWQGMSASVVLQSLEYQLLLADAPPVSEAEMSQAVRWKIRDMIDYSLDEAAVDSFRIPDDAYRGRQKMLYVAAMKKSRLHELVDPLEECGLVIDRVEASELAINNLVCRLQAPVGAQMLVHLDHDSGFVSVLEEGQIYLTRELNIPISQLRSHDGNPVARWDDLLLELQRSRDFYESQMGKGIVTHLVCSPDEIELVPLLEFFSNQLGLSVDPLELSRYLPVSDDISLAQRSAATAAVGAALGPTEAGGGNAAH